MKIINRTQFLKCPPGTVFSKYKPCVLGKLGIKGETQGTDFLYQPIVDSIDMKPREEFSDAVNRALDGDVPMDMDCQARDGCFCERQLFAVWSLTDVVNLGKRLDHAVYDSMSHYILDGLVPIMEDIMKPPTGRLCWEDEL